MTAPSSSAQFSHHLSLLASRTDSQRRDSLSYLTTAIICRPADTPVQQPPGVYFPKILPLILDGNNNVRVQLLKLLHALPSGDVEDYVDQILLYVRAGMTHLAVDINSSAMDVLSWAIDRASQELVSCSGGWFKTLKVFLAVFGWSNEERISSWSTSNTSLGNVGSESKALTKNLNTLAAFLRAGLVEFPKEEEPDEWANPFPLWHTSAFMLPKKSNCFAHLNLFGPPRDEESEMYEDREERQRVFHDRFQIAIEKGLSAAQQGGGEVGRAAAAVKKTIVEGMDGYEPEAY